MARLLYDYWFVQFDFPDENGRPYKSSGGKMVWNDNLAMEIPKYWEAQKVKDICHINRETAKGLNPNFEIEYLDTSSVTANQIKNAQRLKKKNAPSRAQRKVRNLTILYSLVRPSLKHYGILINPCHNLIASTGFATLDVINQNYATYLYLWLTSEKVNSYLAALADTSVSAYPSINPADIEELHIIVPPEALMRSFYNATIKLFTQLRENEKNTEILEALRDELLPLLMNGQVTLNYDLALTVLRIAS